MNKFLMTLLALSLSLAILPDAFAVGTVTVTKSRRQYDGSGKLVRVVKIHWVADASAGTVPATDISGLHGFLVKAVTKPGATAPTTLYDITLKDKTDAIVDVVNGTLADRSATVAEIAYPVLASGTTPVFVQPDTYTFAVANNSVNSAIGDVYLYFVDSL